MEKVAINQLIYQLSLILLIFVYNIIEFKKNMEEKTHTGDE